MEKSRRRNEWGKKKKSKRMQIGHDMQGKEEEKGERKIKRNGNGP